MWNLKKGGTNELIYKTEPDSQTQRLNLWSPGEKQGDSQGVWDQYVHTVIF